MNTQEAIEEAHKIQQRHKAPGVVLLALQVDGCPFGIAMANGSEAAIINALPDKLREIANTIENEGVKFVLKKPTIG